jgi:hypothetical protein
MIAASYPPLLGAVSSVLKGRHFPSARRAWSQPVTCKPSAGEGDRTAPNALLAGGTLPGVN